MKYFVYFSGDKCVSLKEQLPTLNLSDRLLKSIYSEVSKDVNAPWIRPVECQ